MNDRTLGSGFRRSRSIFPDRPALEVNGHRWSYDELGQEATELAATLQAVQPTTELALTMVLAHRSITAFAGILGTLFRGHGYVPLNPNFPAERIVAIINRSRANSLVVGSEALPVLDVILDKVDRELFVYLTDCETDGDLAARFATHRFIARSEFREEKDWNPATPEGDSTAYLLFTSGSTGAPKGVQVSHRNIRRFIDVVAERYQVTENDRLSQMFELVFDLSLFDMFVAWECGACLCCPTKGDAQMPARYINESRITIWFSVPSLAVAMSKMRMLRPDSYPELRLSLFCGEALRADIAEAWSRAAPNSVLENLYGPTEVTLACTYYRWERDKGPSESTNGLVPIGYAFPGMTVMIADETLKDVSNGQEGELLMAGPQVAIGYWEDSDKTNASFLVPPGKTDRYYRTGDLVYRRDESSPLEYRGRIDHQVKIRGNRIELGEIEALLRNTPNVVEAVALGWPVTEDGVAGIAAFLQSDSDSREAAKALAEEFLPSYMVPNEYRMVNSMPLNQNGKIDRKALLGLLENS